MNVVSFNDFIVLRLPPFSTLTAVRGRAIGDSVSVDRVLGTRGFYYVGYTPRKGTVTQENIEKPVAPRSLDAYGHTALPLPAALGASTPRTYTHIDAYSS